MFGGLKIISKGELALYAGTIQDLRAEKQHLEELVEHERHRAEAAINLLLMKTQRAAITPMDPMSLKDQEHIEEQIQKSLNIFGDDEVAEQAKVLEELQK